MPAHQCLGLDDREDLEDRRKQPVELHEEPTVAIGQLRPAVGLPPQDDELLSKRRVFRFKAALRLEQRRYHREQELDQRDHVASLANFGASSTWMRFSAHTAIGARARGANVLRATVRVTFWGALAMALTASIGKVFGAAI